MTNTNSLTPDLLSLAREREAILADLDSATSVQIARLNRLDALLDREPDWRAALAATKQARAEREAARQAEVA